MLHALAVRRPSYQETLRLSNQLRAWHDAQARLPAHPVHPQHRLHRLQNYTIMHLHHTRAHVPAEGGGSASCTAPNLTERKDDRDLRPARSRQTCPRRRPSPMLENARRAPTTRLAPPRRPAAPTRPNARHPPTKILCAVLNRRRQRRRQSATIPAP
ncbi:hypothetical protein G3M48_003811 [Beauveria asiatica]|uniref:Uncharacterized protein n=1 Tax=Beauveria asiatica TaxID=1069075 RepID=A0AAW0RVW7_9HYPO